MKIIQIPNEILRKRAKKVNLPLSDEDKKVVEFMVDYIDNSQKPNSDKRPGIGIAAPQVNKSLQMFYINVPGDDENDAFREFLINPEIIGHSEKFAALENGEGCLSVPINQEKEGLVHRYFKIIIKGFSYFQNKEVTITKSGYHAIVLQHEYDHLQGILFIDRINNKKPFKLKENEILI